MNEARDTEPRLAVPPQLVRDAIGVAGTGLLAYGAWLVFPPLGFVAGGAALLLLAVVGTLRGGR